MKLIIGVLFSIVIAFASENKDAVKAQILEKIFTNISMNKDIVLWSDNKNLILEFKKSGNIVTTQNIESATLVILEHNTNISCNCQKKLVFVLEYNLLKELPDSFGALFWQKGRPNIVIIAPRIKSQNIAVSKELEAYLEEKIW